MKLCQCEAERASASDDDTSLARLQLTCAKSEGFHMGPGMRLSFIDLLFKTTCSGTQRRRLVLHGS